MKENKMMHDKCPRLLKKKAKISLIIHQGVLENPGMGQEVFSLSPLNALSGLRTVFKWRNERVTYVGS